MNSIVNLFKPIVFNYVSYTILATNIISCTGNKVQNKSFRSLENEKVYNYYQKDSLKLKAARFLISNMPGLIHIENENIIEDTSFMKSSLLIENINEAFDCSYSLIKSNFINFDDFCEYVLPYRVNCATIEPWRRIVWKKFRKNSLVNLTDKNLLIDSINQINRRICPDFKFGYFNFLEDTLRLSTILKERRGTCETMSNLASYTFNALGVPIAKDYVICWANENGNHVWNTLLLSNHFERPFLGTEQYINNYDPLLSWGGKGTNRILSTFRKPGKVYRMTFSINDSSIAFKYRNQGLLPPSISNYRCKDVTNLYCKTTNIVLSHNYNKLSPISLLCNYSSGDWIPVDATDINRHSNNFKFDKVALGILYQPAIYFKGRIIYKAPPFYINDSGVPVNLKANHVKTTTLKITHTKSIETDQHQMGGNYNQQLAIASDRLRSKPIVGKTYNLFYWENKWNKVGTTLCNQKEGLVFKNVPSNCLYLITNKSPGIDDRPFIVINYKMKWL